MVDSGVEAKNGSSNPFRVAIDLTRRLLLPWRPCSRRMETQHFSKDNGQVLLHHLWCMTGQNQSLNFHHEWYSILLLQKDIRAGLDIGAVAAKLVLQVPAAADGLVQRMELPFRYLAERPDGKLFGCQFPVLGQPVQLCQRLLGAVVRQIPPQTALRLCLSGSNAKSIAAVLGLPHINEFKAIARGVAALIPAARTILEIGGDGSRYLQIVYQKETGQLDIVDYARNGECAAGTGSFIDQQVARMRLEVADIGGLVTGAGKAANIAGRCSVFAKSDMVHAQQRGYAPGAILKGLCEAVVRNYKGTVLRGKSLSRPVVFAGGVAANHGVVEAMAQQLEIAPGDFIVPEWHVYAAALGCALIGEGVSLPEDGLLKLARINGSAAAALTRSKRLDLSRVCFPGKLHQFCETPVGDDKTGVYLGIDVGSVSTNLVLLDTQGLVVDEIYTRTEGKPVEVVDRELRAWKEKWAQRVEVLGVGTTGSGREMIGELVGADTVNDEITAHKTGAAFIADQLGGGQVDTIFEIGGQDAKFISIEDGVVVDFTMNEACAAGTGSFLEEQANKLGISIVNEFADLAMESAAPVAMGERCTVFMEKDVSAFLQQGVARRDIAAGLAFAVVQNYLNRVVRGRKIGEVIFLQGGTAYNRAVAAAFSATLDQPIIVPPHCGVMGAIGAALLAKNKMASPHTLTRFHGFDLAAVQFTIRHFTCKSCSNQCDMQEVTVNGQKTYWGDKCSERYRSKSRRGQKAALPDLIAFYNEQLERDVPGPDGLGLKIGVPRAMYFFDRFPFWRAYFAELGAELILSSPTNRAVVALGREHTIAEPCFPILAAHGHVVELLQQGVDYLFMPTAINAETDTPQTESWYCPWGQTLPLVFKNTFYRSEWCEKILSPVVRFRDGRESVAKALYGMAKGLGIREERHRRALEMAYAVQAQFQAALRAAGEAALQQLKKNRGQAVVLVGRPYNLFDAGLNLNVPAKLRSHYGIDVIPMDFLPCEGIDVAPVHENMFWSYGRRILQAATFAGRHKNLHVIYFTNFKCGPDSYIKHFVRQALGAPFLTLQFDEHGNDAGILTRCEAYLQSKGLLGHAAQRAAVFQEKM